jgi:response regulator RpfG family c-di-GMP phosphodiesterase
VYSTLISDPDATWARDLRSFFQQKDHQADIASNGKESQLMIYKNEYQIVILDLDIENNSSLEVLRYIKLNAPKIKVILTLKDLETLKKMDVSKEDLKKLGAFDVLTKPFPFEKVLDNFASNSQASSWKNIQGIEEAAPEEVKASDDEFTRIKFADFLMSNRAIYDHYVRIGDNKFIRVLHRGELFEPKRLEKYKSLQLEYLYFKTKDRATYINYINSVLAKTLGQNTHTKEVKLKLTQNLVEKYIEEIYTVGLKPSLVEEGKAICQNMYSLVQKETQLFSALQQTQEFDPEGHSHLFLVSFFSAIICKHVDWAKSRTIESVVLGSLLHDIGMLKIPLNLQGKTTDMMTSVEKEVYMTHPKLGAEMLNRYPIITEQIKQIVYQHHEYVNGSGFPNTLNNYRIYPLAKIVSLADEFADFMISTKVPAQKALQLFVQNRHSVVRFDPVILQALIAGFVKDK